MSFAHVCSPAAFPKTYSLTLRRSLKKDQLNKRTLKKTQMNLKN
jgi:hypothetical protein